LCNDDLIQQYPSNEDGQDTAASPNEDSNEGNAQKTAFETKQGRPKTSVVWIAFEKVFDKGGTVTEVKCKSCPAVFLPSKSSSTTHLLRHMNNCCTNNIASKNKRKVDQIKVRELLSIMSIFFRIVEHELINKFIKLAHCIGKKFLRLLLFNISLIFLNND
jgi:hypothetical protein